MSIQPYEQLYKEVLIELRSLVVQRNTLHRQNREKLQGLGSEAREETTRRELEGHMKVMAEHRTASKEFVEYFKEHLNDPKHYKGDIPVLVDPTDSEEIRKVENCMLFTSPIGIRTPEIRGIADLKAIFAEHGVLRKKVTAMNSQRQHIDGFIEKMTMKKFLAHVERADPEKVVNLLQFTVNGTRVAPLFKVPDFVEEVSMVENIRRAKKSHLEAVEFLLETEKMRRADRKKLNGEKKKLELEIKDLPNLFNYLLISQAGAFTGAHIDFGGTCTMLHVISGSKIFYIADKPWPNVMNWHSGIPLEEFRRVVLKPGHTFVMRPGVTHFVYTPEDSIVLTAGFTIDRHVEQMFDLNRTEELVFAERSIGMENLFPRFGPVMYAYVDTILVSEDDTIPVEKLEIAKVFQRELEKPERVGDHLWSGDKSTIVKRAIEKRRKRILRRLESAIQKHIVRESDENETTMLQTDELGGQKRQASESLENPPKRADIENEK